MRVRPTSSAAACLLATAYLGLAGCGSSGSDSTAPTAAPVKNAPAPPKGNFPKTEGRSLGEVLDESSEPSPYSVTPGAMVFYKGGNRYPFGVSEKKTHVQVGDAEVALYLAKVPTLHPKNGKLKKGTDAQARIKALEEPAIGPFPASIESLATKPAFESKTTREDPEAATSVYLSHLDFPSNGEWRIAAAVKVDGELSVSLLPSAIVGEDQRIPRPGQEAPLIHTPTAAEVGGDLSQITTRVPPDTQNMVDYADALGREPILLLFATPQFCESRVCGPVVDVAEQVKKVYGGKAAFIHMEIWKENDPTTEEVRPQVRAFRLPTEPWLFAIDREGKVVEAIEGAFGVQEMTRVVKKAIED